MTKSVIDITTTEETETKPLRQKLTNPVFSIRLNVKNNPIL